MHEMSLATRVIEIASEHARRHGAEQILAVQLRIGALSCVHKDALIFSFGLAAKDTILEGAKLQIVEVPVTVFCETCQSEAELSGIQMFRCPRCGTPSADIRQGRELDIDTIEIPSSNSEVRP